MKQRTYTIRLSTKKPPAHPTTIEQLRSIGQYAIARPRERSIRNDWPLASPLDTSQREQQIRDMQRNGWKPLIPELGMYYTSYVPPEQRRLR